MRAEAGLQPQQVTLGAHERCHGWHRVRVGQKYPESHLQPMIVDTTYLQYRVRHNGLPYLVFHWTTYCLDRNPFRYTSSPLVQSFVLRCDSSGLSVELGELAIGLGFCHSGLGPHMTKISSRNMRSIETTSGRNSTLQQGG